MSAIWKLYTNTLWQQSVMQSCGHTVFGIYIKISLHCFGLAWDELHRMEVSHVFVLWVLSALHPTFHWWPVQAAAAMGSKYAWALPVAPDMPAALRRAEVDQKEAEAAERELLDDGYVTHTSKHLVAAPAGGWSVGRGLVGSKWLCSDGLKGRNEQCQQHSLLPLLSWNSAHGALHKGGCTFLWNSFLPGTL